MRRFLVSAVALLLAACAPCHTSPPACTPLDCSFGRGINATRATQLRYSVNYGADAYEVTASFDVHFVDGSSTNGCTASFGGRYGEPVSSEVLSLSGEVTDGEASRLMNGSLASEKRYYLTGIIEAPVSEEARQRNLHALSIQVEERYTTRYSPK